MIKYVVVEPFQGHQKGTHLDAAPEGAGNHVVPVELPDPKPVVAVAKPAVDKGAVSG